MIRALIFDFDGLILDTETPEFQSWQEIYEEYGCSLSLSIWAASIGRSWNWNSFNPYNYLEEQVDRPVNREEIRLRRRRRYAELIEAHSMLPGVEDYIANAKRIGLKLGLASSSPRDWVTSNVSRLGLSAHFDCIKCTDDVKRTKPESDLYYSVLGLMKDGLKSATIIKK